MNRAARTGLTTLAAVAIGLLALRVIRSLEYVEEDRMIPAAKEARENPLLAARRYLAKRGLPSRTLERLEEAPPAGATLLLGAPDLYLPIELTSAIAAWTRQGGHLIAAPCEGAGWRTQGSAGKRLLASLGLSVECPEIPHEFLLNRSPIGYTVQFSEPDELLAVATAWVTLTDLDAETPSPEPAVVHSIPKGEGRVTLVGDTAIFNNDQLSNLDHARILERLATLLGPGRETWLVQDVTYPTLFQHLWATGLPVMLPATLVIGLLVLRRGRRFGPPLPSAAPGNRSLMDHVEAVGALLWKRRPEALLEAARDRMLQRLLARRPADARRKPEELVERLARLGEVPVEEARRAIVGPDAVTKEEFTRAIVALESIRRSL